VLADIAKAAAGKKRPLRPAGVDADSYAAFARVRANISFGSKSRRRMGRFCPSARKTAARGRHSRQSAPRLTTILARVRLAGFAMGAEAFEPVEAVKAAAADTLAPDAPSIAALPLSFVLPNARLPLRRA
jgi:hypothetical protein